jgi:hypothetical protein
MRLRPACTFRPLLAAPSWENWAFHSPDWWRRHWEKTGLVEVEVADLLPDGWKLWLDWDEASLALGYLP